MSLQSEEHLDVVDQLTKFCEKNNLMFFLTLEKVKKDSKGMKESVLSCCGIVHKEQEFVCNLQEKLYNLLLDTCNNPNPNPKSVMIIKLIYKALNNDLDIDFDIGDVNLTIDETILKDGNIH